MNHSLYRKRRAPRHPWWCAATQTNHCGNQRRTVHLDDDAPPGGVLLFPRGIPTGTAFQAKRARALSKATRWAPRMKTGAEFMWAVLLSNSGRARVFTRADRRL